MERELADVEEVASRIGMRKSSLSHYYYCCRRCSVCHDCTGSVQDFVDVLQIPNTVFLVQLQIFVTQNKHCSHPKAQLCAGEQQQQKCIIIC